MKFYKAVVVILAAVILFGCSNADSSDAENDSAVSTTASTFGTVSSEAFPYSFNDSTGAEISLTERPVNTAVLFSSLADIWQLSGGVVSITVGESVERGFCDSDTPLVDSGAGKSIDVELLVSLKPDFVIYSPDIAAQSDAAKILQNAGIPCAGFRIDSIDDYLFMLEICTDITGDSDAFTKYGTDVKIRVNEVISSVSDAEEKPEILFIRSGSSESSAKAKRGSDHFAAAMLDELGCSNIADDIPILVDGLSIEEILTKDPDFIFVSFMGNEEASTAYMDNVLDSPGWSSLTAVKEGRCIYLPREFFQLKPNDKWDEAYTYLAEILYPDVFSNE